ncbi:MAG: hypothetical protein LBD17_05185 [Endomicrobium sp.]|jgi:hypothetical protein|nr:hypothetical protein [Endomicrobium sp.]
MKKLLLIAVLLFITIVPYSVIFADHPNTISLQGIITDNSGAPISDAGTFTFNDGSNTQTTKDIPTYVNRGLYSLYINISDLRDIDFSESVNVEISYNGTNPRTTQLTASPYAFWSATATFASTAAYASSASYLISGYRPAEIYASKETLEPGDVVLISQDVDNNIEISKSSHSIKVAGIISTKPGLVLNSKEQGYMLALIGKVPVEVINEGVYIAGYYTIFLKL